MKLYRYIDSYSEEGKSLMTGNCAPSNEYLKYSKNPRQNLNSFPDNSFLAKYFYLSFYDALRFANSMYNLNKRKLVKVKPLIWEIDMPDELVKKYLGLGYYNATDRRIEAKIPYHLLASFLGFNLDEEFLNELKELETKYTCLKDNLELFKKLLFPIFSSYGLYLNNNTDRGDGKFMIESADIAYQKRMPKREVWQKELVYLSENWSKVGHGPLNEFLFSQEEVIKEENENIKRALTKEGYSFKRR